MKHDKYLKEYEEAMVKWMQQRKSREWLLLTEFKMRANSTWIPGILKSNLQKHPDTYLKVDYVDPMDEVEKTDKTKF